MRTVTNDEVYEIIKENYIQNNIRYPKSYLYMGFDYDGTILLHITRLRLNYMDLRSVKFDSIARHMKNDPDIISQSIHIDPIDLLCGCDFEGSNLSGLDLPGTNLRNCNFTNANLKNCNFHRCDFLRANMEGALVDGANFAGADLTETINLPDLPMACPKDGEFIAYKICFSVIQNIHLPECIPVLVKLLIPEHAERSSGTSLKCRSSEAKVLDFEFPIGYDDIIGNKTNIEVKSLYTSDFTYKIGKTVSPRYGFVHNRYRECAGGIHFYANREDAISLGLMYFCSTRGLPGHSFTFA